MLKKTQLLGDLPDEELNRLAKLVHGQMFMKNAFVLREGDKRSELLFLLAGKLQVVNYTEQGREVVLHTICSGEHFGELSVIDGKERSASVVATDDSIVVFLNKDHALSLFHENPLVARKMLQSLTKKIRQSSTQQMMLSNASAHARVYMKLFKLLESSPSAAQGIIDVMPTQQDFASMVNTSRETVSRAIQSLVKQGIIKKEKRCIVILKPKVLEDMLLDISR